MWFCIYLILLTFALSGCQDSSQDKADTTVTVPGDDGSSESEKPTQVSWLDSTYDSPTGEEKQIKKSDLIAGELKDSLETTFVLANSPIDVYNNYGNDKIQRLPFLSFVVEKDSKISVRHIKYLNGEIKSSNLIIPFTCPKNFQKEVLDYQLDKQAINFIYSSSENEYEIKCIPLINTAIPDFLSAADINGMYSHEFTVSVKFGAKKSSILSSKVVPKIVIPNNTLDVSTANELKTMRLYDRYKMVTETKKNNGDINYGGRRDFVAFELSGSIAPGIQSNYVINTEDKLIANIEEEVFFELPVVKGDSPSNISISRGYQFYKRKVVVDSEKHFGLRLYNIKSDGSLSNPVNIPATGRLAKPVEIPIDEPNNPIRLAIALDFGAEGKPLSTYFYPFYATFCESNPSYFFEPANWMYYRNLDNYVECDALTRSTINNSGKLVTNPVDSQETYFGSFSFMAQNSSRSLGGTNGIYSLRVSLYGKLSIKIKNPGSQSLTDIGTSIISISYMLPNVVEDMEEIIKNGKAPGGLDIIASSMRRKGVYTAKTKKVKKLKKGCISADSGDCGIEFIDSDFPFQNQISKNILY